MSHIDVDYKRRRIEDEMPSRDELICTAFYIAVCALAIGVIAYKIFFYKAV